MNLKLTNTRIVNDINWAGVKVCKKCKEEFPATANYFYKASGNKDGLRCECKRCTDNSQNRKEKTDLKKSDNIKAVIEREKEIKELKENLRKIEIFNKNKDLENGLYKIETEKLIKINTFLAVGFIIAIFGIVSIYFYK